MIYGEKFLNEFSLFKKKKNKCPIDEETKEKITEAAEACAKKINSKYLSEVKHMMKNADEPFDKKEIDNVNFSDISVFFSYDNCYDIEFDSINQDVFILTELEHLGWNNIAESFKNDINKVITNPELKIKKYDIGDDCAVISLVYKL